MKIAWDSHNPHPYACPPRDQFSLLHWRENPGKSMVARTGIEPVFQFLPFPMLSTVIDWMRFGSESIVVRWC